MGTSSSCCISICCFLWSWMNLTNLRKREREKANHHRAPNVTEKASRVEEHRGWGNVSGKPWQFQNQHWKYKYLSLKIKKRESIFLLVLLPKLRFHFYDFICVCFFALAVKVTKFHSLLQTCETCCCHWNQAERLKKRKKKKKEAEIAHPHTIQSYKGRILNLLPVKLIKFCHWVINRID